MTEVPYARPGVYRFTCPACNGTIEVENTRLEAHNPHLDPMYGKFRIETTVKHVLQNSGCGEVIQALGKEQQEAMKKFVERYSQDLHEL